MPITCVAVPFTELSGRRAHDLWRLRQDVFVVEQACAYADLDGRDVEDATRHVLLEEGPGGPGGPGTTLLGCARVLEDADVTEDGRHGAALWRIGRVVLTPAARGRGLADVIMTTALAVCVGRDVVLHAQSPLARWYAGHGFEVAGPEFLEDDIPHLPMRRAAG